MSFDVEHEIEAAIASIGGQHTSKLVGRVPGHENADFVFTETSVIAELKCLDEDKINDRRIIKKASDIYAEELRSGRTKKILFGSRRMTTKGFSEEYTRKIASLYRVPIERQIKKANSQIATTAVKLGMSEFKGLLIIANNNHSALDPGHGWYIMNEILNQPVYDSINSAIYLSGNLAAAVPGNTQRLDYWIEITRPHRPAINEKFLIALRNAWYQHLSKLFREPQFRLVDSDLQTLMQLESKRGTTPSS
ncbi:hypothetical protein [Thiobacillus sp.]|uniref:hypothetical protein n=1 Tax=Thiobacillus sp. TaxID=924 RepID=UPI00286DA0EC|nr:hypothetical protein [Thiobacillus sp.]